MIQPELLENLISSIKNAEKKAPYFKSSQALAESFSRNLDSVQNAGGRNVLIYGAGMAGEVAISEFKKKNLPLKIAGFLDQNNQVRQFCGFPVLDPNDCSIYNGIDAVVLCAYESEPVMRKKLLVEIYPKLGERRPDILPTASSNYYAEYCKQFRKKHFIFEGNEKCLIEMDNAIIFIAEEPYFNLIRHSIVLRDFGLKTVLITRDLKSTDNLEPFFDKLLFFHKMTDLQTLNGARILGIHVQNWATKNYFPIYIQQTIKKAAICEFQDLSCLTLAPHDLYKFAGLSRGQFNEDILFEKLIFKSFKSSILPYKSQVIEKLKIVGYEINPQNLFHYPIYPCRQFFTDVSGNLTESLPRLLFVGGIPPDFTDDNLYHDAKLHTIVESLIKEGFCVKILNNPKAASTEELVKKNYPFFHRLNLVESLFTFEVGLPPDKLRYKAIGSHLGLMIYEFSKVKVDKAHYDFMIPSKFFTYMELGLPVIVSRRIRAVAEMVQNYDIGLVVEDSEAKNLKQKLKNWRDCYPIWIKNVKRFREKVNMHKMVPILISAYRNAGFKIPR
jgi:glycosyltransferase involved in cell wall biosynthesis